MPFLVDTTHHGDQPPGPDAAPDRAPGAGGAARCRRAGCNRCGPARGRGARRAGARESWMHVEVDRLRRSAAARRPGRPAWSVCWATCARRCDDWKPMLAQAAARPSASCSRRRRRCRAAQVAESRGLPAMAGQRPLDPARLPLPRPGRREGRGHAAPGAPAAAWACCARAGAGRKLLGQLRGPARRRPRAWHARRAGAAGHARPNTRSTVHRPGYTDYVGVKRYNATGEVIGEHRFIGLFTSTAYSARVDRDPAAARQGRGRRRARRLAARRPPGQGAATTSWNLPARRPVPDRRRRSVRHRAGHLGGWASASGCACSSGATRSTASSRAWSTCRARPIPPICA